MRHRASVKFWAYYDDLPDAIQELADEQFRVLKQNPRHLSLHFKKVGQFWSARVGIHYRALAVEREGALVWFWIGHHSEYDRIIKGR